MKKALFVWVLTVSGWPALAQTNTVQRADSLASAFEYGQAVELYRTTDGDAFEKLNGLATAEHMLGLDFLSEGAKDSAEAHFERAIVAAERMADRYPDSADTHFQLAAAYGSLALLRGGKTKVRLGRDVEEYALKAVAIDSTHADALSVLGVFYREVAGLSWIERLVAKTLFGGLPSGSLEKSEDYLRRAVHADSTSPFATFELGQTLAAMDRPEDARIVYERLMELTPRNSENRRDMQQARQWLMEEAPN